MLALSAALPTHAAGKWQQLITQDSFEQWTIEGASKADFEFDAKTGTVTGRPVGNNPKNSFLCSPQQYKDFELKFRFKIRRPQMNSGVQFRSEAHPEGVRGPQFEMDVASMSDHNWLRRLIEPAYNFVTGRVAFDYSSAAVYGEDMGIGWIYPGVAGGDPQAMAEQGARLTNKRDWNPAKLRAKGPHIETWLAGMQRADFKYPPIDKSGVICLQVHGGKYSTPEKHFVQWRNLVIREL